MFTFMFHFLGGGGAVIVVVLSVFRKAAPHVTAVAENCLLFGILLHKVAVRPVVFLG
jgi:hypothetical protein